MDLTFSKGEIQAVLPYVSEEARSILKGVQVGDGYLSAINDHGAIQIRHSPSSQGEAVVNSAGLTSMTKVSKVASIRLNGLSVEALSKKEKDAPASSAPLLSAAPMHVDPNGKQFMELFIPRGDCIQVGIDPELLKTALDAMVKAGATHEKKGLVKGMMMYIPREPGPVLLTGKGLGANGEETEIRIVMMPMSTP